MNISFFFKSQLINTFTESKDSNCFILYFEQKKNVFNASDLIFTGSKCHVLLLILEQGILSEMFHFKLLKKSSASHLLPVNIKSEALNTFFCSKNDF